MNGVRTFEIYLVEDKPYGYEISSSFPVRPRGYNQSYDFPGKSAHIVIATNDCGIDRSIALGFATAIANGTFKTIHIDLTELGTCKPKRPGTRKN